MSKTTKNYKDTVFSSLFYECENAEDNARSLYKALTGKNVEEIEKCRLEEVLFREFKNDVAYIMDGKWVCFIEHQSTINPESVKLSKVQNGKQDLKTQRPKRCFC